MSRIYISSSFRDLVEHRKAAAAAIRSLGRHPVAMEDYVALDERPLDKCLEDVRRCQIYVGILGWRYGHRPTGDRSITEREYDEALAANIPCLVFLTDDACLSTWPAEWVDSGRDGDAVQAFRRRVQDRHVVSYFSTAQTLEPKVIAAVSLTLERLGSGRIEIPPLLPYMCDRSVQSEQLKDALDGHRDTLPRRPMLVFVHGEEREAHHAFVERLQQVTIPRLLGSSETSPPVHIARFAWSEPSGALDERIRRLNTRVAEALTDRRRPTRDELAQDLARKRCPVMLCTTVLSTDWQAHEPSLLRTWSESLAGWPDLPADQLFMSVIVFVYKNLDGLGFWARRTARRQNEQVAAFVASPPPALGVTTVALARLEGAAEGDVLEWMMNDVAEFCRKYGRAAPEPLVLMEKLRPWVSETFSRSSRIPMETLAVALRQRLVQCFDGATD